MAFVTIQDSKKTLAGKEDITDFLNYHGITYSTWQIPDTLTPYVKKDLLSPEEKSSVIASYQPELERLKAKGYIDNDMVCLCPQTPQIEELLSKFDKDHYHTD